MSRVVVVWAASSLVVLLLGSMLGNYLWLGAFALFLVWAFTGLVLGVRRLLQARDPARRSRSLRDVLLLAGCAIGVLVLYWPLQSLGSRVRINRQFNAFRPTYDSIVARLPDHVEGVSLLTGPTGEYFIDPGRPVRVAFVLPPGRFIDNWCGVVYDPSGQVLVANHFDGNWKTWHDQVPTEIIELFGGDLLGCSKLEGFYYHCCFT
jgi:hypothetical protein